MIRKQIGKKIYDVTTACRVCNVGNGSTLYKQKGKVEFFTASMTDINPVDLKTARRMISKNKCSSYYKRMFCIDENEPQEARRVQVVILSDCYHKAKAMADDDKLATRWFIQKLIDDEYNHRHPAEA